MSSSVMPPGVKQPTLLVIDDEQSVRYSFRRIFEGDGVAVLTAGIFAFLAQQEGRNVRKDIRRLKLDPRRFTAWPAPALLPPEPAPVEPAERDEAAD